MKPLHPDQKIDLRAILEDLATYRPKRKGWTWRRRIEDHRVGPFTLKDASADLRRSIPLPSAHHFGDIDPQCDLVITTEIA
jgi:D-ornithine 4,5-aminomutase subunit beta